MPFWRVHCQYLWKCQAHQHRRGRAETWECKSDTQQNTQETGKHGARLLAGHQDQRVPYSLLLWAGNTPADVYGRRTVDCWCHHCAVHSGQPPKCETGWLGIGGEWHHRLWGHCEVTEESMDTELSRQMHATKMITLDQENHRLEALAREQDHTCNEAVKQVQTRHLQEMEATADAPCHSFKCHSASQEGDSKQTHEESPKYGTMPRERGRSLQWMDKCKADRILASPGKRRLGSLSYTPCKCAHTPCNHSQSGHRSSSRCRSHSRCCSHSTTPNRDRPCDRDSTSRKRPVDPKSRPIQPTSTQSPTQKTLKLKSIIQRAPAYQHFPKLPYKSLRKEPKDFIRYLQGSLDRKVYDARDPEHGHTPQQCNHGPLGFSKCHNHIGSCHQRDQVHVIGNTDGVDEQAKQPHKCGTPRAPHRQRGLAIWCEDPLCLRVGVPPETAPVLAWCQLPVWIRWTSVDGGQAGALCILPCQWDAEPREPLHLAPRDHGQYALV